ncbi:hypothetical protein [Nonomuraea typhae]|uniref:hypothetical protein n=1 Tax=Nonomuraea typhae TaxID=2603600 RepID=UPI0012F972F5|nr:hypothetical protein [Nonomuraea typhae]
MSEEPRRTASPGYAYGQLQRAMNRAAAGEAKAAAWRAVLDGMETGRLTIGSRTPVADTPAWVTLEVAHGGFATGRYVAETPLSEAEAARFGDREQLNLYYLSDEGQAELLEVLASGRYRVDAPEDAALMTAAWLLDRGHAADALDLVVSLRPLMHRLRMTPRLTDSPAPSGATVRLAPVGEVKAALRAVTVNPRIATMLETLRVWLPLYDRLVALWCDTVEGELPELSHGGAADGELPGLSHGGTAEGELPGLSHGGAAEGEQPGQSYGGAVEGGWPCRVWPADWTRRRTEWLADYREASQTHAPPAAHTHPKSNFARLRRALDACEYDSSALTGRDVGWIRRVLVGTVTRHGAPGSERRAALRSTQAVAAARPTHAALAAVLAGRLDRYPEEGGIPAVEPLAADTLPEEAGAVHPIPPHLAAKLTRALEAPVDELVARGVITSGEVLARVLPQITAQLVAADLGDEHLAGLYAQTYGAFRRRRSLLLLNLEHQVRFDELPWIGALEPFRAPSPDGARTARRTLAQATTLALTAFPQTILPNPLLRELGALAERAGLPMPLVEEVAADIFMGSFTTKWRTAAEITSRTMAGTLYARYYDLPEERAWTSAGKSGRRWGKRTAEDFATLCAERAKEAQTGTSRGFVAANGTVLEQSQILTTHNLAALVHTLHLEDDLRAQAPALAERTFTWIVAGLSAPSLRMVKNMAYGWRQAIFYLSFCDRQQQEAALTGLRRMLPDARLAPAVKGLSHVIAGGRFAAGGTTPDGSGRRFLGWTTGAHWCLPVA